MPLLILFAASRLLVPSLDIFLLIVAFWAGLIFPDIDVITGFIRTTFQTMLLIVLMGGAVLTYPPLWGAAVPYCPVSDINGVIGPAFNPLVVCQGGLAVLLMAAAWVLSYIMVFWLPAKNSFHSWTSAAVMSGGVGMFNNIARLSSDTGLLTAGFALGYALHILADTAFNFVPGAKKRLTRIRPICRLTSGPCRLTGFYSPFALINTR